MRMDLHEAAEQGSLKDIESLLARGADANKPKKETIMVGQGLIRVANATPLIVAAVCGHVEIVRILLKSKADPNRKASEGLTPLFLSAMLGNVAMIRELVAGGAGLEVRNDTGDSPLFAALNFQEWEAARELVRLGAPMDDRDLLQTTPLLRVVEIWKHSSVPFDEKQEANLARIMKVKLEDYRSERAAKSNAMLELANELIDAGCDFKGPANMLGVPPILKAAEASSLDMAKLLLERGADPNSADAFGVNPLSVACKNLEMVRLLLDAGADPDQVDDAERNALFHAVRLNLPEAAKIFIAAGADLNRKDIEGKGPLDLAAEAADRSMYDLLVKSGAADVGGKGEEALRNEELWNASSEGNSKKVSELLKAGADANVKSKEGKTALWIAADQGHTAVVEKLLVAGAKARAKGYYNDTALHRAAQGGHAGVVKALLATTAAKDLEGVTDFGSYPSDPWTPLLAAAESGNAECVRLLLDAGAKIEFKSKQKQTALLVAALHNRAEAVAVLLERGAKTTGLAGDILEPLEFPKRLKSPEIAKRIKELQKAFGVSPYPAKKFPHGAAFNLARSPLTKEIAKRLGSPKAKKGASKKTGDPSRYENMSKSFLERIALEKAIHQTIEERGASFLESGCYLVYYHSLGGDMLVLSPTANPYAVVASLGPAPKGIPATIEFLQKIAKLAPWRLRGASYDTLMIQFTKKIGSPEELAKKIFSFRADERGTVIDGEVRLTDTIKELAKELKAKNPIVRLWWD